MSTPLVIRLLFALLLVAAAICGSAHAGDFVVAPVTGAAVVTDGKFANIYLYPDPSTETWEQHLAAQSGFPNAAVETRDNLDAFVLALSQNGYFSRLSQYTSGISPLGGGPINAPQFLGRQNTIQACVDAAIKDAHIVNNVKVLDSHTLGTFAGCENAANGGAATQVNIFLSPEFDAASGFGPAFGIGPNIGVCDKAVASAFHSFGLNIPNFTVIPTRISCNPGFDNITRSISHEMIETLSDPAGLGYIHEVGPIPINGVGRIGDFNVEFNEGELADICEPRGPKNPNSDPNIAATRYGGFAVSRYWSNIDNDCEPQAGVTAPLANANPSQTVNLILFDVLTGGDNLRDDSTASADITVGGKRFVFQLKSGDDPAWEQQSEHVKTFSLPSGPLNAVGQVSIALQSHDSITETPDNWNVQRMTIKVLQTSPVSGEPDMVNYATCLASVSGNPFKRLTGSDPQVVVNPTPFVGCGSTAPPPTGNFNVLMFTIGTGGDDLRDNSSATASIIINGQTQEFTLKAQNAAAWSNDSSHQALFLVGMPQPANQFGDVTIALQSHNGAFQSDDNWNIQSIAAKLIAKSGAEACYLNVSGDPFSRLSGSQSQVTIKAFSGC